MDEKQLAIYRFYDALQHITKVFDTTPQNLCKHLSDTAVTYVKILNGSFYERDHEGKWTYVAKNNIKLEMILRNIAQTIPFEESNGTYWVRGFEWGVAIESDFGLDNT